MKQKEQGLQQQILHSSLFTLHLKTMGLFSSESKFESSVMQIPYPQEAVYNNISDLRNLEKVQDRVPEDKVNDFKYDEDTVTNI